MTSEDYRRALETAVREYEDLGQRRQVLRRQAGGLGPLARSRRSEQDEVQRHGYLQGKPIDSA